MRIPPWGVPAQEGTEGPPCRPPVGAEGLQLSDPVGSVGPDNGIGQRGASAHLCRASFPGTAVEPPSRGSSGRGPKGQAIPTSRETGPYPRSRPHSPGRAGDSYIWKPLPSCKASRRSPVSAKKKKKQHRMPKMKTFWVSVCPKYFI